MKKPVCGVLAAIFLMTGCAGPADDRGHTPVLPPTRTGASSIQTILASDYTFETAYASADAVARVEVGDWLREDTDNGLTYYAADTLECFKGELPDTFSLIQDGCSEGTLKNYPLFTAGNELFLFLRESKIEDDISYWIIGAFTTVLNVAYDAGGNRYYVDNYGILGATIPVSYDHAGEAETFASIYAYAMDADPMTADMRAPCAYIFCQEDIVSLMEQQ